MNILFLTLARIESLEERGVYTDLLRRFNKNGFNVYVVSPIERRFKKTTFLKKEAAGDILNVQTLNIQKTNLVEKGLGTLLIEYQFLKMIKKYFHDVRFDLVLYSTPPITFSKIIHYIKKRDNAFSYLLLKDIFPQNAVDLKMMKKGSFIYEYFRKKERVLYEVSDAIGCMSKANKDFILKHNPQVDPQKVEINPNTIEPQHITFTEADKMEVRKQFHLPLDKKIFVYGGNLGKPQGVEFVIDTIEHTKHEDVFFLIIGSGTEYGRVANWFRSNSPSNAALMKGLPKAEYEEVLKACDVGMLFLHRDFTVPNFPSRLLSYLELKLPVLAATDLNTDVGTMIEHASCGYAIEWGDRQAMQMAIEKLCADDAKLAEMKEAAWNFLITEFDVDMSFQLIKQRLQHVSA